MPDTGVDALVIQLNKKALMPYCVERLFHVQKGHKRFLSGLTN